MKSARSGLPSGLLFDFDGTLVDSAPAICDAVAAACLGLGCTVAAEEVRPHLGAPLEELFAFFLAGVDASRFPSFVAAYIEAHDAHPQAVPAALPGVLDGLESVARAHGVPMAVATTKPTYRARKQVEAVGLAPHFAWVQGTDEGMAAKPAPDVVHQAARGLGLSATSTWMIGDTRRDVEAARAAGALAIAVAYTPEAKQHAGTFGADFVIGSVGELLELLRAR